MIRFAKLGPMVLTAVALLAAPAVVSAHEKAGEGTESSRASSSKKMSVKRLVLARGIDGHEPQDVASTFAAKDDRVYAFVEVENLGSDDTVAVVFEPPSGPALGAISLKVGGGAAHFRTWAFTRRAHEVGDWTVVVRDTHGKVLGRQTFTVTK